MKAFKRITLISAAIACVLGIIIMALALMAVKFDVKALDVCGEPIKLSKAENVQNIKSISVNLYNSDVVIKQSRDEKVWVTYYTTDCCPTVSEISQDGEFKVYDKSNIWEYSVKQYTKGFFHGIRRSGLETVIEIPADCDSIDIYVNTSNGKICAENMSAKNIEVYTSNGKVEIGNVSATNITVDTSNGNIDACDISVSEDLRLNTSNGDVTAEKATAGMTVDVDTSNGKIDLYDINAVDTITASTSNGNVDTSVTKANEIELTTSNGKINISYLEAKRSIRLETSNGDIEGDIIGKPEDYCISSGTSNGNNSLAIYNSNEYFSENDENTIWAYTSNGNITVQFSE